MRRTKSRISIFPQQKGEKRLWRYAKPDDIWPSEEGSVEAYTEAEARHILRAHFKVKTLHGWRLYEEPYRLRTVLGATPVGADGVSDDSDYDLFKDQYRMEDEREREEERQRKREERMGKSITIYLRR